MKTPIISAITALAALAGQALANPVGCTYGELERTVEVVYSNPGQPVPCEVIYNKSAEGTIQTLWRANSEAGYCEAQAAGLVDKLEAMGWDCSRAAAPATIEETIDESFEMPADG